MSKRRVIAATGATLLAAGGVGLMTGLPASTADPSVPQVGMSKASERAISRQQAARVALRTIERRTGKQARVTGIGREDDYGARWEVEVTLRNGREFDVYVNGRGKVVRVIANGRDWRGQPPQVNGSPDSGTASRSAAAATALAHIEEMTGQSARVTGVGREDDYGARWEVEVTLANGFEYDVYIGPGGEVIKVKENGFDD